MPVLLSLEARRALPFACGLPCTGDPGVADPFDVGQTSVCPTSKNYLTIAAGSNITRWSIIAFISTLRTFNLRNLTQRIFDLAVFTLRISTITFNSSRGYFLVLRLSLGKLPRRPLTQTVLTRSLQHRSTRSAYMSNDRAIYVHLMIVRETLTIWHFRLRSN